MINLRLLALLDLLALVFCSGCISMPEVALRPDQISLEQRQPKSGCYARHVLHSDPEGRFTILSIVWDVGQFSPAHAHHTWCGYGVLDNSLEETVFRYDAARNALAGLPASNSWQYVVGVDLGFDDADAIAVLRRWEREQAGPPGALAPDALPPGLEGFSL